MDDQSREYQGQGKQSETPAIGLTYDQKLDDFRHVVFQSFVAADCKQEELNALLDKLRIASERQKAIAHLPTYRGMLQDKQDALKSEAKKHFEIETSRDLRNNADAQSGRRNLKPTAQQVQTDAKFEQALANSKANIATLQKEIVVYERQIADMEKLIADGA